jgi:hypothetical protein
MKTKLLALLAIPAFACAPSVGHTDSPSQVDIAVFDPTTGNIPLPNDLALIPANQAGQPAAQVQLLQAFAAKGGFPNDQEVPITISFQTQAIAANGTVTTSTPSIDVVNQISQAKGTLVVFLQTKSSVGPVELDPIQATDYANGTLTLHNKGRAPWAPGEYIVGIRGGTNGVKASDGTPIVASSTFFLIAQGRPLTSDADLALLRAQAGTTAAAETLAAQLNAIIANYTPAYAAVDQVFPHQELAVMTTFAVAPARAQVQLDPNRGLVPLPIDLLRDPRATNDPSCAAVPGCGLLTPIAACTLAQGTFNPATGACSSPAAAGFATLDGFSTTGFILAPTSDLLLASTITPSTVQLYDLTDPTKPTLVDATTYITEPAEVQQSGLSPVVALQPAGATASDPTSVFRTRPLKENTMYAVVISDSVADKTGAPIVAGTVGSILQISVPLLDAGRHSLLSGVDDTTAGALEIMRAQLAPVLAAAAATPNPAGGTGPSLFATGHVAMAYTFKTQSFLSIAAQLAALPYTTPTSTLAAVPSATNAFYCNPGLVGLLPGCPAGTQNIDTAFANYGLSTATFPDAHIGVVVDTSIVTFNKLLCNAGDTTCADTGAFNGAAVTPVAEPIKAVIALPPPPFTGGCVPGQNAAVCTVPLVVFRHGLGSWRGAMLALADNLTQAGFVVAAIDANKFGDRSFCSKDSECNGGTCNHIAAQAGEGDAAGAGPGKCSTDFVRQCSGACTEGNPVASGDFFISSNFFRTRDSQRQDIIDESQLVRVLSPNPFCKTTAAPTDVANTCANNIITAGTGVQIDPTKIYYVGQSLGAINGAMDVAANPRFSKAVLNVGGGTAVDIFSNSPAFVTGTNQLLGTLGIQPGTAAYLQFLVVAKTVLDPADPVNYAAHLTTGTLQNFLVDQTGKTAQSPKAILTQAAFCDQTVPNPFNFILDSNVLCPSTPLASCAAGAKLPVSPTFGSSTGNFELFWDFGTGTVPSQTKLLACPAPPNRGGTSPAPGQPVTPGSIDHAFITDWVNRSATSTAQTDSAAFLSAGTLPPSIQVVNTP